MSCREQAAGQQQRHGARSLRLLELAEDLEAESATWRLFWTLHGVADSSYPGGGGGALISGAGSSQTSRQKAAELLEHDQSLNQCASPHHRKYLQDFPPKHCCATRSRLPYTPVILHADFIRR